MKEATEYSNKCKQCGRGVKFGGMKEHWLTEHPNEDLPLHLKYQKIIGNKCLQCGRDFNSPQALTWHRKNTHGVTSKKPKRKPTETSQVPKLHAHRTVTLCPCCGCDIEAVQAAINLRNS